MKEFKSAQEKQAILEQMVKEGTKIVEGTDTPNLKEAQKNLTDYAQSYGYKKNYFSADEGLFQFIENPQTLELILSDDRRRAIAEAKANTQKAMDEHEEAITGFNGVINARSKAAQTPENIAITQGLKAQRESLEKALLKEKKWLQSLTALEALLNNTDVDLANWKKVDEDKQSLKEKLAKVLEAQNQLDTHREELAKLEAQLKEITSEINAENAKINLEKEKREAVTNSVKTIAHILNELIPSVKDAIINPYEFSMVRILKNNIPKDKGIESIEPLGTARGIINDPNSKFVSMGFSAAGSIMSNTVGIITAAVKMPSLIKGELGDNIEDPNALLQSDFMEKIITEPALYEMLSRNADNFGEIIWNFQNDLVALIQLISVAPEEESNIAPETLLKLTGHLLNSSKQLKAITLVVSKNIPLFQKMFQDEKSAFYKLAINYGVKDPTVIATLIPALLKIVEIIPSQYSHVKAIFEKVSKVLMGGEEVTIHKIIEIANLAAPILKSEQFKGALLGIFAEENSKALITIVKFGVSSLAKSPFAALFPKGMLEGISTLITAENIYLIQNILKGVLDMAPELIGVASKHLELLEKLRQVAAIQAKLANPDLKAEDKQALKAKAASLKLTAEELKELSTMGLEMLKVSGLSNLISENAANIQALMENKFIQSLLASSLPKELKNLTSVLPQLTNVATSIAATATTKELANQVLKALPSSAFELLANENAELTAGKVIKIAQEASPLLETHEFRTMLFKAFEQSNVEELRKAAAPILNLIFGERVSAGLLDDKNFAFIKELLESSIDMLPELLNIAAKHKDVLEKIRQIEELQAKLNNPKLSNEERSKILSTSKNLKLESEDLGALSKMGLELLQSVAEYRAAFYRIGTLRMLELKLEKGAFTQGESATFITQEALKIAFTEKELRLLESDHPALYKMVGTYKELFNKIDELNKNKELLANSSFNKDIIEEKIQDLEYDIATSKGILQDLRAISKVDIERAPVPGFPEINAPAIVVQFMSLSQNEFLRTMVAEYLPKEIKGLESIIPHLSLMGTTLISAILNPQFISRLIDVVPDNITSIANGTAYYEPVNNILEVFREFLNSPGFKLVFEKDIVEMVVKNRDIIKPALDELLKSNPAIRKYNINSEKILNFLADKDALHELGEALNDIAQNKFLTRTRGISKIAGIIMGSQDTRSILWNIIIDGIVAFVRENILPNRLKRWISGVDIESILNTTATSETKDLAAICKSSYAGQETRLSHFLLRTQNFSGQNIRDSLEGFTIDTFSFKEANFKGDNAAVINLRNAKIANSNMSFNLSEGQTINLTGATLDIRTLKSMMHMFEAGKVTYTDMKLSATSHKEVFEFTNGIDADLKQHLQNTENCLIKGGTHAEKVKSEKRAEARSL
ncbi:MAG: hypothetical protein K0R73_805 [Candidatus Midichloriaceae bacterium]|jgi:hypothetical protein|nr:hypothetical protein [Candidatus Midichloriaceae bacterium]